MIKILATFRPSLVVREFVHQQTGISMNHGGVEKRKCDTPSKIRSKVSKNTVDGQNPAPPKDDDYPIIYRVK